jgi:hypothetical protein
MDKREQIWKARKHQGCVCEGRWTGWTIYPNSSSVVETPDTYRTRREALEAIKAQHPGDGR